MSNSKAKTTKKTTKNKMPVLLQSVQVSKGMIIVLALTPVAFAFALMVYIANN